MVDQRLVSYVKQQLAAGHDITSVRHIMLDYGYDINITNEAILAATKKEFPTAIVVLAVLVVIVIISLILILPFERTPEPTQPTGQIQTIEIPVTQEKQEIEIPQVTGECPADCDDNNECTRDECSPLTDYICVNRIIRPCCGNTICESIEDYTNCPEDCTAPTATPLSSEDVVTNAKSLAATSPSDAINYCTSLAKESSRDTCHKAIAEQTGSSSYCENVVGEVSRDNCYVDFALIGDYSVCDKITNIYLKQSCKASSQTS